MQRESGESHSITERRQLSAMASIVDHLDVYSRLSETQIRVMIVMAGLYLGIAVAGVEALIAMGLVIAFI